MGGQLGVSRNQDSWSSCVHPATCSCVLSGSLQPRTNRVKFLVSDQASLSSLLGPYSCLAWTGYQASMAEPPDTRD